MKDLSQATNIIHAKPDSRVFSHTFTVQAIPGSKTFQRSQVKNTVVKLDHRRQAAPVDRKRNFLHIVGTVRLLEFIKKTRFTTTKSVDRLLLVANIKQRPAGRNSILRQKAQIFPLQKTGVLKFVYQIMPVTHSQTVKNIRDGQPPFKKNLGPGIKFFQKKDILTGTVPGEKSTHQIINRDIRIIQVPDFQIRRLQKTLVDFLPQINLLTGDLRPFINRNILTGKIRRQIIKTKRPPLVVKKLVETFDKRAVGSLG